MKSTSQLPVSVTNGIVVSAGLASFLTAVYLVRNSLIFPDTVYRGIFVILATAAAISLLDIFWQKVHLRSSTGLDFSRKDLSWGRVFYKWSGLAGSFGFVALFYWLFPEYHGSFYARYFEFLRIVLPYWLVFALPYFAFIDRRMIHPRDGYWQMGQVVLFRWRRVDGKMLGQHLLGWVVKGYFMPLMFTYLCNDLDLMDRYQITSAAPFRVWYDFLWYFLYFIDVGIVSVGYLVSLRLTDTHLRSTEPTIYGWVVALVCYEPFWSLIGRLYLQYEKGYPWNIWLNGDPVLYVVWGSLILGLTAIYVWASVVFGGRFSNLTHRGILTNGPYRFTKHPAYIAKNLSWWMISIPFIFAGSWNSVLRGSLLLLMLNGVYFLRARTEERHLSQDPAYIQYAEWMETNGLFSFLNRFSCWKFFAYRAPQK